MRYYNILKYTSRLEGCRCWLRKDRSDDAQANGHKTRCCKILLSSRKPMTCHFRMTLDIWVVLLIRVPF